MRLFSFISSFEASGSWGVEGNFLFYPLVSGEIAPISPLSTSSSTRVLRPRPSPIQFLSCGRFCADAILALLVQSLEAFSIQRLVLLEQPSLALRTAEEVCDAIVAPDEGDGCERAL